MAIQVTGFFPNAHNESYVKDPVITLQVKQVPMGKLSVDCLLCVSKEYTYPGNNIAPKTELMQVSMFSINDIDRTVLSFDASITDPYEQLLASVQDFLIDKFTTENPTLTLAEYVSAE